MNTVVRHSILYKSTIYNLVFELVHNERVLECYIHSHGMEFNFLFYGTKYTVGVIECFAPMLSFYKASNLVSSSTKLMHATIVPPSNGSIIIIVGVGCWLVFVVVLRCDCKSRQLVSLLTVLLQYNVIQYKNIMWRKENDGFLIKIIIFNFKLNHESSASTQPSPSYAQSWS